VKYMKLPISSKSIKARDYVISREIIQVRFNIRTNITVEIFEHPTYYCSCAKSPYRRHREPGVFGIGKHLDKETSIILAVDNLYREMRKYNEHTGYIKY
jgi:hypothetical protein